MPSLISFLDRIGDNKHLGRWVAGLLIPSLLIGGIVMYLYGPGVQDYCKKYEAQDGIARSCHTQDGPRQVYTKDDAFNALTDFGPDGREAYARGLLVDLTYPVIYGTSFVLGIIYAFRRLFGRGNGAQLLVLLALAGWLADWLENISVLTMIIAYPNKLPALGHFLAFDTPIKWLLDILALTIALTGLILSLVMKPIGEEAHAVS
jgi:hypothetical protein